MGRTIIKKIQHKISSLNPDKLMPASLHPLISSSNIAVTGTAKSGKSVFFTSLLWNLQQFRPHGPIKLKNNIQISNFSMQPVSGYPEFPFLAYQQAMVNKEAAWPSKTLELSALSCEFKRSDYKLQRQRLEFFDFPGERFADAAIAAFSSFEDWCEYMCRSFMADSAYAKEAVDFINLTNQPLEHVSFQYCIQSYRKLLAGLFINYKPLISPSTFVFDTFATSPCSINLDELVAQRYCGLPNFEFCPLPSRALREKFKDMAANYKKYRREIVLPIFKKLQDCQTMLVLVDMPTILNAGRLRYDDTRQIIIDLFQAIRPDDSVLGKLSSFFKGLFGSNLQKLAFIATKADLIHPEDIRNGNYYSLLCQLVNQPPLPGVRTESYICSACCSTFEQEAYYLQGRVRSAQNQERELRKYKVSALPGVWPTVWQSGNYSIPEVYPLPTPAHIPPRNINLDRVLNFILG